MRHNLIEIDFKVREVLSRGSAGELFHLISRRTTYVNREIELQKELETKYNFFIVGTCD